MPSPPSATVDPAHRKVLLRSQSCSIGAVFLILLAGLLRIYPENSEDRHRRTKYLRLGQIVTSKESLVRDQFCGRERYQSGPRYLLV